MTMKIELDQLFSAGPNVDYRQRQTNRDLRLLVEKINKQLKAIEAKIDSIETRLDDGGL